MGCCTGRCFLITLCFLQLVSTIERQVFDFLGYMWAPIIGNFLQIIFVITGLFGAYQYRPKVVIVYAVWCLVWLGWNIFVICFYLEVGILKRDSSVLNIGTGNRSWWLDHGIGCRLTNTTWVHNSQAHTSRQIPPEHLIEGCLLQYYYVEIIHAGVQCVMSLFGFCVACFVIYVFTEEDDSSQPVNDELEYIKMRYKSPARSSYRDLGTYETLTRSTFNTTSTRGIEGPHSDSSSNTAQSRYSEKNGSRDQNKPSDRIISELPWVKISPAQQRRNSKDFDDNNQDPRYTYNMLDQPPGVTVI